MSPRPDERHRLAAALLCALLLLSACTEGAVVPFAPPAGERTVVTPSAQPQPQPQPRPAPKPVPAPTPPQPAPPPGRQLGVAQARARRLTAQDIAPRHEGERARVGDVVLENDLVRFVIAGSRYSDGYAGRAGVLVDATLEEGELPPYDGLDELIPQVNGCPVDAEQVTVEHDGSDGRTAEVRVSGPEVLVPHAINFFGSEPEYHGLSIEVRYTLEPRAQALRITTTVYNTTGHQVPVRIGDFVHFGDDEADPYTVPYGFDLNVKGTAPDVIGSAHETLPWAAAVYAEHGALPIVGGHTVDQMVGGKRPDAGLWQYVLESELLEPGESLQATRHLALGRDSAELMASRARAFARPLGRVTGRIRSAGQPVPYAKMSFFASDSPASFVAQAITNAQGVYSAELEPGSYRVVAGGRGNGEHVHVPGQPRMLAESYAGQHLGAVEVTAEQETPLDVALAEPARVRLRVRDETGRNLPVKLTFEPEFELPALAAAIGERNLYEPYGIGQLFWTEGEDLAVSVLPGSYTITASHGPRHSLALRAGVALVPGENPTLDFQLEERVPAQGFVAIDSHLHGMDGQHGEVTRAERVITARAEGLDVHVSTDHDRIVDYTPVIEELGLASEIAAIPGVEMVTPRAGHHTFWPLPVQHQTPNGGGIPWWLGGTIHELYERYEDMGAVVRQLAHGKSYFVNAGFDLNTGTVRDETQFTYRFNAMELHNGKGKGGRAYLVPAWYALLNSGRQVAPVAASDSHWRIPEAGSGRTYVDLGGGEPAAEAVASAVVGLRTVASTGPLITLSTLEGARPGDHLTATRGAPIVLHIQVWAPDWMPIDSVRLIANGQREEEWARTTVPAVASPGSALVPWFEHEVEVRPESDTWYAVEAEGDHDLGPVYPNLTPWAHTAPVFVEVR